MKKRKLSIKRVVISVIILLIFIGIIISIIYIKNQKNVKTTNTKNIKKTSKKNKCKDIVGGSYYIVFNTNNESKIDNMSVCIGCAPNTYNDLPVPTYEGYNFDGWFYDSELTKKVEEINTSKILPIQKKDKNNCIIGYEDINIYAKWNKIEQSKQITQAPSNSYSEETPSNKENIPNVEISSEETSEMENNPSEQDLIKSTFIRKPTSQGQYNNTYDTITAPNGPVYSISKGKVMAINSSYLSNYYKMYVSTIVIFTIYNDRVLYIRYELASPRVNVGDYVTDDTMLGFLPKGGDLYMTIYPNGNYSNKLRLNSIIPLEGKWDSR